MKTVNFFEANGQQVSVKAIETAVKKELKTRKIQGEELDIYFNADEMRAYYAVDGLGADDQFVDF